MRQFPLTETTVVRVVAIRISTCSQLEDQFPDCWGFENSIPEPPKWYPSIRSSYYQKTSLFQDPINLRQKVILVPNVFNYLQESYEVEAVVLKGETFFFQV